MHKEKVTVQLFNSRLQQDMLKNMPCPYLASRSVGDNCYVDLVDFHKVGGCYTLFVSKGDDCMKFDYKTKNGALNQTSYWIYNFNRLWTLCQDKAKYSAVEK